MNIVVVQFLVSVSKVQNSKRQTDQKVFVNNYM